MSSWLLAHPPLLGPAVETAPGWPQRWVPAAAAAGPAEVVVGFSVAGIVLPAVAAAVGARRAV